jgi:membrane protein DedA with SNARE-associated domain
VSVEAAYWYAVIYFGLLFTGIGIPPVPEEAMIIAAAGITATQPEVRWYLAWPATIAGIVSADAVLYWVGRLAGWHLFEYRWVNKLMKPERRARIERRFDRHGIKILLTARLLPPLRTGVFLIAGAIKYPFTRFLIADAVYAVFGVGVVFFGSAWVVALLHHLNSWAVYVVAGLVVAYLLHRYYGKLREQELKDGAAPPVSVLELPTQPTVHDNGAAPSAGTPSAKKGTSAPK